jgi:dTDP-glucose 4,6-dehydratase
MVVITGGAGFIGQTLARMLASTHYVTIFDHFHHRQPHQGLVGDIVQGNVLRQQDLAHALTPDVTHIVHAAALAGITTPDGPTQYEIAETDAIGTWNVLHAAKQFCPNLQQIVLLSTSEVYGTLAKDASEDNTHVEGNSTEKRWAYAAAKLLSEHLVLGFANDHGVVGTVVRPFNIYGPGQLGKGAINNFVRAAIAGEPLIINNEGQQTRAWCYIDDFVSGLRLLLEQKAGGIFNIGNPTAWCTTVELAEQVVQLADSTSRLIYRPSLFPDVWARVPNIGRISALGFKPTVGLTDGIRATIDWQRQQ